MSVVLPVVPATLRPLGLGEKGEPTGRWTGRVTLVGDATGGYVMPTISFPFALQHLFSIEDFMASGPATMGAHILEWETGEASVGGAQLLLRHLPNQVDHTGVRYLTSRGLPPFNWISRAEAPWETPFLKLFIEGNINAGNYMFQAWGFTFDRGDLKNLLRVR